MMFAPPEGWRHVKVTDRHTAVDYAHVLKDLADLHFANAKTIVLVQDNLNIHSKASLYEAFPAAEARRLVERFEWHYTPKHGSWLDLAESELGVLSSQCLDRRIPDKQTLVQDVALGMINGWLVPSAAAPGLGRAPFRAASAGTVALGLAGGSLTLCQFEPHRFAATMLAGIAGAIAVFALLGYLTGVDTLYGSVSVNSPPLPTAAGLLCISSGIISRIGTMPVLRKSRPLWHLLVMLGCAIVAPLLLFGAYAGFRIADAQLRDVQEGLSTEARTLSAKVDSEIIGEIERLQALAASPSLRQGDFADFQHQAEASLALRRSGNIVLIDRNMQQLVHTAVPFGKPLPGSAVPKLVERVLATGQPTLARACRRAQLYGRAAACCDRSARYCRFDAMPARPRPGAGNRRNPLGAATVRPPTPAVSRSHL